MGVMSAAVAVQESSQIAEARRAAVACAAKLRFDAKAEGKVAIVATELATNLVKHGSGGELVVTARQDDLTTSVELLAIDSGPGMDDWRRCLDDGYSTSGSPGTGLGAIRRAAEIFDVYSRPSRGTVAFARITSGRPAASRVSQGLELGVVSASYPGEVECGDGWSVVSTPTVLRVMVVDGLGHGMAAAEAARAAEGEFQLGRDDSPTASMERIHRGIRHTRGAAVAVAELDVTGGVVSYCGVGNIAGIITSEDGERHLVTHNGVVGHEARRIQLFTYPWKKDALLLLHSDGLATHWRTVEYPGLVLRHPALVAGVLYRDYRRRRDDVTVVVVGPKRVVESERSLS